MSYGNRPLAYLTIMYCFKLAISNVTIVRISELVYDTDSDNEMSAYEISSSQRH
jgi:hypothetical protein